MSELFAHCTRLGLKKIYARFVDETETAAMAAAAAEVSEPSGEETELEKLLEADEIALSLLSRRHRRSAEILRRGGPTAE